MAVERRAEGPKVPFFLVLEIDQSHESWNHLAELDWRCRDGDANDSRRATVYRERFSAYWSHASLCWGSLEGHVMA